MNTLTAAKRGGFKFEAVIEPLNASNKTKIVRFEVGYLAGSRNKGVNVWVRTIEVEQCEGYNMETFELMGRGNFSMWARVLPRKSDKAVLQVAEKLDPHVAAIVSQYITSGAEQAKSALLAVIGEGL
jgi:hypothetical protein